MGDKQMRVGMKKWKAKWFDESTGVRGVRRRQDTQSTRRGAISNAASHSPRPAGGSGKKPRTSKSLRTQQPGQSNRARSSRKESRRSRASSKRQSKSVLDPFSVLRKYDSDHAAMKA